ncbi:hypothetical protein ECJURUA1811_4135 [Escherichia coli Jurua 18/11]|nr:hypothetical protein ECDEC14C_4302 [Escherichia coli DEC14C]EMU73006.1 hypothetical protein ECMP0210176_5072 [Escherichia coli MP021017.6]EMU76961.1 hypothetical protein ECMP0210179_2997 [Escherichia coli MP021017.9]EMU79881.1 hypothetical protein ECMP0210175_3391 [Escherichia coli MP021017.5]EMU88896.1 hypothetical protein ECMP0210174_4160 [Escherichia coli MP021017.4]EMU93366.1 hypothetical protein ECMP0210173_3058 [Escherichia coli MP021017.3]EMU94888.1 hypothetical protein ECMP0210172_
MYSKHFPRYGSIISYYFDKTIDTEIHFLMVSLKNPSKIFINY